MTLSSIIIGGGLAGTTIAATLLSRGKDFLLIEASKRLGGKIETLLTNEACFEFGPNSFTNQEEAIFDFLKLLDLRDEVLESTPASRYRYILKKGKIVQLPAKPPEILTTKSLSFLGRLRFLREYFYVPKKTKDEESVIEFFSRHFGKEIALYFADPFVSGIFAGDATKLSLKEAFPTMAQAEAESSSLIRYLIKKSKTAKATPQIFQMKKGLESIFHRALEKIGRDKVHLSEKVLKIIPEGKLIKIATNQGEYQTSNLFLTSPAYISAQCLKEGFPKASEALASIEYAPVISIHLKVPKEEIFHFNGFGILIPSIENRRILGVLWNSSVFPSLFGDQDNHYLTVYAGGMRNKELALENEDLIEKVVCEEVQELFSLKNPPTFIQSRKHLQAIPQYTLGYGKILQTLKESLAPYPLKLAGNYLGGISIPRTVSHAMRLIQNMPS